MIRTFLLTSDSYVFSLRKLPFENKIQHNNFGYIAIYV